MKLRMIAAAAAMALMVSMPSPAHAANAICYNCPPQWADWGTMLKAIKTNLGIDVPLDDKNSGQTLAQLITEKNSPVADVAYYGVAFGIRAKEAGVVAAYKPKHWDDIPAGLKDPDGYWFAIHYGTLGLFINRAALGGKPVPQSWKDLLKPEYKGMVGYLDPSSAAVGYAGAVAINQAFGGTLDDFTPVINYLKKLQENRPIVPKQTSYARVLSGEIPILIDYDFNAYRAKYKDGADVVFVIPKEGTVKVPYVMSLVKGAPHAEEGEKILDFVLSDKGQAIWANAFLHPVRGELPPEIAAKFNPASEYKRAHSVDFAKMAEVQKAFIKRYLNEVR